MELNQTKERFLSAIQDNPQLLDSYTWKELEEKFRIPQTSRPGDRARKWYKRAQKQKNRPQSRRNIVQAKSEDVNLKLKSKWQAQTKEGVVWMESYEKEKEEAFDPEVFRDSLLDDMKKFSPKKFKESPKEVGEVMIEFAIPDFHIGRVPVEEAKELFKEVVQDFAQRASTIHKIEKIVFPIGNDWLNTDNSAYQTTRGTQQFDVDSWETTFRYGWQILVEAIEYLAEIAPVDVIVVAGNHDRNRMFYIGDVVSAWFNKHEDVTVDNSTNEFKFTSYGDNLIMYEHGELKPFMYPVIMADEQPHKWAASKFREVHTGHFHKEMVLDEIRRVKVRFLPSIAKNSKWEKQRGYKNLKQSQLLVWHKTEGLIDILLKNKIEDARD